LAEALFGKEGRPMNERPTRCATVVAQLDSRRILGLKRLNPACGRGTYRA